MSTRQRDLVRTHEFSSTDFGERCIRGAELAEDLADETVVLVPCPPASGVCVISLIELEAEEGSMSISHPTFSSVRKSFTNSIESWVLLLA